ncbi:hypothetical protein HanHA89_Chr03g0111221 [Helianthus annuus]|nr:hypothetical protein HanHA89_Chr03g0111221 [Helianthus annuus]
MLIPSIRICPAAGSTRRKSVCIKVDFPLPVLPTIPVFFPPLKVHVRPLNTSGICGAYRTFQKKTIRFNNKTILTRV